MMMANGGESEVMRVPPEIIKIMIKTRSSYLYQLKGHLSLDDGVAFSITATTNLGSQIKGQRSDY